MLNNVNNISLSPTFASNLPFTKLESAFENATFNDELFSAKPFSFFNLVNKTDLFRSERESLETLVLMLGSNSLNSGKLFLSINFITCHP